jgi:hypothetical protein
MDLEISRQFLEKSPSIGFQENLSTGKALPWLQASTESSKDVRTRYYKWSRAK